MPSFDNYTYPSHWPSVFFAAGFGDLSIYILVSRSYFTRLFWYNQMLKLKFGKNPLVHWLGTSKMVPLMIYLFFGKCYLHAASEVDVPIEVVKWTVGLGLGSHSRSLASAPVCYKHPVRILRLEKEIAYIFCMEAYHCAPCNRCAPPPTVCFTTWASAVTSPFMTAGNFFLRKQQHGSVPYWYLASAPIKFVCTPTRLPENKN